MKQINDILKKYNIKPHRYTRNGKVTIVDTEMGNFVIKKGNSGVFLDFDIFLIKAKATLIELIWNDSKSSNLHFLNEILNNLPKELHSNFFIINRKCRDNIHYGFYNSIGEDEYIFLKRNQNIYINYIIEELSKKIIYVFDKKYNREIKIANFLYKFFNKN